MRWIAGIIGFLAVLIVLLPNLGAQDKKEAAKPLNDANIPTPAIIRKLPMTRPSVVTGYLSP